jgi:hypothetical protein
MKIDSFYKPDELESKPDFNICMERIYAWYNQEIIDRVPIRFTSHNAEYNEAVVLNGYSWKNLKERWFDTEYQLELFEQKLKYSTFNAETFPVFWPNLGPEVYTAFYGVELEYNEVTSYSVPSIKKEIAPMTHNIFHVDGKGVARHLDKILELPEINAIQWVQGMGNDTPIMQWVPLIKKVQSAGISLVIDLKVSELEPFMSEVDPRGILLCIDADLNTQNDILRRVKKWK